MKIPVTYGLTMENQKLIQEKAKGEADGCYMFRGVVYKVRAGKATHFASDGKIVQPYGAFNVTVGQYEFDLGWEDRVKKILRGIKD